MKYSKRTLGKKVIQVVLLSVLVQGCVANPGGGGRDKGPIIENVAEAATKAIQSAGSTPVEFKVRLFRDESGEAIEEGDTLRSGERYKFKFTPSQNCYVYILQFDSSQKMFDLIQMADFDHYVQAGQDYYFPRQTQILKLDNTKGPETIHFLASATPLNDLKATYQHWHSKGEDIALNEGLLEGKKRSKGPVIENVPDSGGTKAVTCEGACIFSRTFRHE